MASDPPPAATKKPASAYGKVTLIPWSPTDDLHYQRMVDQRVACGWREEEVPEWREKMLSGQKFLYWVVLADDLPDREKLLAQHVERYEKEREPLTDTATTLMKMAREPTNATFLPIGHIALETIPARNEEFKLAKSTYWIMSLYISWALQFLGLGRSAMLRIEHLATQPPLLGTALALDTVDKAFHMREDVLRELFEGRGLARPPLVRSNEEWYVRQGYEVFLRQEEGYPWKLPSSGEVVRILQVYLKKDLV